MKKNRKEKKSSKRKKCKKCDWTVNDFVNSVWGTMEKQAMENKSLNMLHARLSPEWNRVTRKIYELLEVKDQNGLTEKIEEICGFGREAVRPLIDTILKIHKGTGKKE